jgi:hypothetical protein
VPTTRGMLDEAMKGADPVVTAPHYRWLEMTEPEQAAAYTDEAIAFVGDSLRGKFKKQRPGRISPSAMGGCPRAIIFGYAGMRQLAPRVENQEMMDHGSWGHLKWQAEGLSIGWLTNAEIWVTNPDLLNGGSMDGSLIDGSIFELKTCMWPVYARVVTKERVPKWENMLQVHDYFLLSDTDRGSIVYEERGSGQFHEFRVERDSKIEREVLRRLKSYRLYIEEDDLPPMLGECELRQGNTYSRCEYRSDCPKLKTLTDAQSLVDWEA